MVILISGVVVKLGSVMLTSSDIVESGSCCRA